jgi:dynein heavy chain
MALLSKFFAAPILKDDYVFSPSGKYYAPMEGPPDTYLEYIRALPLEQRPEVFGFHNNADITKDEREARQLLESTLQTQPREISSSAGKGSDPKSVVLALAKDIASRVPKVFHIETVMKDFPITYNNSMNTVLVQELLRYNKLVSIVHKSLSELQKALKGEVVMSPDLEQVYNAFYDNKIPPPWMKKSFPSLKPLGAYVTDLIRRLEFLGTWIEKGEPPVFWLSGFFFTQSFLTGVMQNYARKKSIEIDMLVWEYTVMRESSFAQPPEDGAYVNGLFLEGAAWDHSAGVLCESKPKVLYVEFPIMYLRPCLQSELKEATYYECPVYKTLERRGTLSTTGHSTNFVMVYNLPRDPAIPESHWVIRGAALFTQLDY